MTKLGKGMQVMRKSQALWMMLAVASVAPGQPRRGVDEYRRAAEMTRKLTVAVTFDQPWFLEGEQVCPTITVANLTSQAVTALAPFHTPFTSLVLHRRVDAAATGGSSTQAVWVPMGHSHPRIVDDPGADMMAHRQLVTFLPGETQRASTCAVDPKTSPFGSEVGFGSYSKGDYRLCFAFEQPACAEFHVEEVTGAVQTASLAVPPPADIGVLKRTGIGEQCLGVRARILSSNMGHHIVVSPGAVNICGDEEFRDGLKSVLWQRVLFKRLADSSGRASGLRLTRRGSDSIEIHWTDASGRVERRSFTPITDRR